MDRTTRVPATFSVLVPIGLQIGWTTKSTPFYLPWVLVIPGPWCTTLTVPFVSELSIVGLGFRKWVLTMVLAKGSSLNPPIPTRGLGHPR